MEMQSQVQAMGIDAGGTMTDTFARAERQSAQGGLRP
jgi:N-methylhydantoinase A/oxoprolinase/acetone carboxylase beta subunit